LQGRGVEIVACRARGERIVLSDMLCSPILHDVTNLLVEGGPTLLHAFFAAGVVDEADVFVAPHAMAASGSAGRRPSNASQLKSRVGCPSPWAGGLKVPAGATGSLSARVLARKPPVAPSLSFRDRLLTSTPIHVRKQRCGDDLLLIMRFEKPSSYQE